ncbi:hypothetical protein FDG09_02215 [Clostridium sporogenes]|uniref:hypothetical protein n=1 Tax=Clostridium sporogenes TaxID=1509 RepID=UPI0013D40317|nr:hypothetical protein [Clostridium sporogenes]NFV11764.1 hypothetical protein [Clostridium sporogenes]
MHTYFIFKFNDEFKEVCIYGYIENSSINRGNIYENSWHKEELIKLTYYVSIKEFYDNLIFNLIPLNPRYNEALKDFLERYSNILKIKKEIGTLKKKAFKESQSKKNLILEEK